MTAIRRTFVLGLAVLLAAATAAADTVVTAREVISCAVESADPDSIRIRLTPPRSRPKSTREAYESRATRRRNRTLPVRDIYEVRLADADRVSELRARAPRLRVTQDSGQAIPAPAVRAREMLRSRIQQVRKAPAADPHPDNAVVDTLPLRTSPSEMAARCAEMTTALLECELSGDTVSALLREVSRESGALGRIWPQAAAWLALSPVGGGLIGGLIGHVIDPTTCGSSRVCVGSLMV